MPTRLLRLTSRVVLALMLCVTLPLQTAQAGMVTTEQVAGQIAGSAEPQRERLMGLLDRIDVRQALERNGVNPDEAKSRVAAMTDAEVAQLNGRLDEVPAGGDVLGVIVFIFLVLLITDILGFTKIFPFTRSVR